jgi:hypothetical protein
MMSTKELMAHLNDQQQVIEGLSRGPSIAFGAACLERQRPIYGRASLNQSWGEKGIPALEQVLGLLWSAASGTDLRGADLSALLTSLLPPDEALNSGPPMAAFTIANAVADFTTCIQEGNPHYAHCMARRGIELIEMLADDLSVDLEHLERQEIARQSADLATLVESMPDVIQRIRANSAGQLLFGTEWF